MKYYKTKIENVNDLSEISEEIFFSFLDFHIKGTRGKNELPEHIKIYFNGIDPKYFNGDDLEKKIIKNYGTERFHISVSPWTVKTKIFQMYGIDFYEFVSKVKMMEVK